MGGNYAPGRVKIANIVAIIASASRLTKTHWLAGRLRVRGEQVELVDTPLNFRFIVPQLSFEG